VHGDRGESEAEHYGRAAGKGAGNATQRDEEGDADEPDEEREAGQARLCGDGHRRIVRRGALRLLSLQMLLLCVRTLEAPDADAEDGMMHREPHAVDDELRTAARRVVQSDVRVPADRA